MIADQHMDHSAAGSCLGFEPHEEIHRKAGIGTAIQYVTNDHKVRIAR